MRKAKEQKRKLIKSMNAAISWLRMARIDVLERDLTKDFENSIETVEELKAIKAQLESEMKEFINEIDKALLLLE